MNSFTSDLIVKSFSETQWQLTEPFHFYFCVDNLGNRIDIIVPKDFVTDFTSVPKILWSILPPTGRYTKASVLHDYLYSNKSEIETNRKQCDKMFLKGMEVLGVKRWVRNTIYRAVRIFGNKYYKKD